MDFYNFNVKSNFDLKWTMTASSLESDCSLLRRSTLQRTVFLFSRVVFSTKKKHVRTLTQAAKFIFEFERSDSDSINRVITFPGH